MSFLGNKSNWEPGETCYIWDSAMGKRRPAKVLEEWDAKRFGYQMGRYYVIELQCHVDSWVELRPSYLMFKDQV